MEQLEFVLMREKGLPLVISTRSDPGGCRLWEHNDQSATAILRASPVSHLSPTSTASANIQYLKIEEFGL
jgi:hypothetical protein